MYSMPALRRGFNWPAKFCVVFCRLVGLNMLARSTAGKSRSVIFVTVSAWSLNRNGAAAFRNSGGSTANLSRTLDGTYSPSCGVLTALLNLNICDGKPPGRSNIDLAMYAPILELYAYQGKILPSQFRSTVVIDP